MVDVTLSAPPRYKVPSAPLSTEVPLGKRPRVWGGWRGCPIHELTCTVFWAGGIVDHFQLRHETLARLARWRRSVADWLSCILVDTISSMRLVCVYLVMQPAHLTRACATKFSHIAGGLPASLELSLMQIYQTCFRENVITSKSS